ncbi:S-formylglutathione hydrolase [Paraferrimonas sedimenticola]|uniref:S-formylglutathione hydrolase n=1 Tax=Paraferrimonas sedimenticola TaxID=375674 RepID=A0AA37VV61_9GAMM|nr:S-formylglutathione hydrolase [Paraferrimonas sedimenticola]GLP96054.1 S-formylglutathione hydrolase [Paraferrimonas sedimenticola]
MSQIELVSEFKCFEGRQAHYKHQSKHLNCSMRFGIFLPPQAEVARVPVLYWLSGLTCTDENFVQKAGAQRMAAELGVAIVTPDTSPRGENVADDPNYDLGQGAGFYLNATQEPWKAHYRMYDYVVEELPELIEAEFKVNKKRSVCGHSMGGMGALVVALRNTHRYQAVSAFSPIVNPTQVPWGDKAFSHYLGDDKSLWRLQDPCELLSWADASQPLPMLIEQGSDDQFLKEQLKTDAIALAAQKKGYPITINYRSGYDHSYFFIASFIDSHLKFHAEHLY